jgi:hypothetical protein
MDPLGSIPKNTSIVEERKGIDTGEWRGCYTREGRGEWRRERVSIQVSGRDAIRERVGVWRGCSESRGRG